MEAYAKHADHTAWRYLSKPNAWMHEDAAYVEVDPNNPTERWSTFERYRDLISLCYVAAIDKEADPIEGYTLETRLEQFIKELALIGRAHNWDQTRKRTIEITDSHGTKHLTPIIEEYDNFEKDKPSCYSGVKRRLFQSVLGHSLFKLLTKDMLNLEIQEFLQQHFKTVIIEENRTSIRDAYKECIVDLNETHLSLLQALNVSPEKQKQFIDSLTHKYGNQLREDSQFMQHITDTFTLTDPYKAHLFQLNSDRITQCLHLQAGFSSLREGRSPLMQSLHE